MYYRALGNAVHMVAISDAQRSRAPDLPWVATDHNALCVETFPFRSAKDDYVLFPRSSDLPGRTVRDGHDRSHGMRTPVVALRRGSAPEIVIDGVTGIAVDDPADSPAAIADADHCSPDKCRLHVAQTFTVEAMARQYEAAYRQVLAGISEPSLLTAEEAVLP